MLHKNLFSGIALAILAASTATADTAFAGPYVGLQLGLAQPASTIEDSDCWYDCSAYTLSKTAIVPGVQWGYYWSSDSFIAGVSAEYSFGSAKNTFYYDIYNGISDVQAEAKYKGVASVRGRMGLVVGDSAIVVSAGPALGRFESALHYTGGTATATDDYDSTNSGSVSGIATGISIEHALGERLMLGLEVSQYSFKNKESIWRQSPGNTANYTNYYKSNHVYRLQTANVSLNWRF